MRYKVIQCYTGGVGSRILRQLLQHPQFDVVGVLVSGPGKHGKDIGAILGLPPVGVKATMDFEQILAAPADAACWNGFISTIPGSPTYGTEESPAGNDALPRLLRSGKNVYSSAGPWYLSQGPERELIDYDQPIARYWPEYGTNGKEKTTVRDVLTHRAGVPQIPAGVTPEKMCDWDWMVARLPRSGPCSNPAPAAPIYSMTFGWLIGECVRRTDPKHRPFGRFICEELAAPLNINDLWIGIPEEVEPRIAKLTNPEPLPFSIPEDSLHRLSLPSSVDLVAEVFERPDVRRACVPGVGGIMNARSVARAFAMLANGGWLGGVRLLSPERVRSFSTPRSNCDEIDRTFGTPLAIGIGGYWLANPASAIVLAAGGNPKTICHPGAGSSIGWADPDAHLAVAICHNRMFNPTTPQANHHGSIADALPRALVV